MNVHCHLLACDEEIIIPYALRHYLSFCSNVVVHDLGSKDSTMDIAKSSGAEIRQWDSGGIFDDRQNLKIKNECWHGTDADWIIVADCDEIIFFPDGVEKTLTAYTKSGLPIAKPFGYEMTSPTLPKTNGQIYEEIKYGGRDDKWYSKCALFSPKLVKFISYSPGAHQVSGTLHNGQPFGNPVEFSIPYFYLLHYRQLGSIERMAELYDKRRAKLCENNVKMNWGWNGEGIVHATDKRNFILSRLERVIP